MSLENDITKLQEEDIFKPVTPKEKEERYKQGEATRQENRVLDLNIIRDLVTENHFKVGKFTDEEWIRIVRNWQHQGNDLGHLEDLEGELEGTLMSFDDSVNFEVKR
jgi:hypothetical protein